MGAIARASPNPFIRALFNETANETLYYGGRCKDGVIAGEILDILEQVPTQVYPDMLQVFDANLWDDRALAKRLTSLAVIAASQFEAVERVELIVEAFERWPDERSFLLGIAGGITERQTIRTDLLNTLPSSAFEFATGNSPEVKAAVCILRIASGTHTSDDILTLGETLAQNKTRGFILAMTFNLFQDDVVSIDARLEIMSRLFNLLRDQKLESDQIDLMHETMRSVLNSRKSHLTSRTVWVDKLGFPIDAFDLLLPVQQARNTQQAGGLR